MVPLKIAVSLADFRLPLKKALLAARQVGAAAVEIDARGELKPHELTDTALRHLRKLLEDTDLRVAAVAFQTRRGYDAPEDIDRRVAATKDALHFARRLGADLVINQVGQVPPDTQSPAWQRLVGVLHDLAAFGQHAGARLAAETGSESGSDLRRLLAALPEGALPVAFNPGKLLINGFAPLEALAELAPDVAYVRAKDAVRDLARARGLEVQLGRGAVDFPAILAMLEDYRYRGYVAIDRQGADDPLAEIAQAVEYLRSLG